MILTELPVEVGALIFTYLDMKSKINLYSIAQLRHFFAPCALKKVDLSRSTLASPKSLDLDVFQTFAVNIQELNLSGIEDLTSAFLSEHIHRFTNLKTLDVTFTEICLLDLQDICGESLKNISINYFRPPWKNAEDTVWMKTIEVFKRQKFESAHFVVFDFDYSDSPYKFMKYIPMPKDLKITLAHYYRKQLYPLPMSHFFDDSFGVMTDIHFEKLAYNIRDCRLAEILPYSSTLLRKLFNLDYTKIEYIFIMYSKTKTIFVSVSPVIHRTFKDPQNYCNGLSINVNPQLALNFELDGNIYFKAWNKATTVFDDDFFKNLVAEFKDYFPTFICTKSKENINIAKTPSRWYCLDSCNFEESVHDLPENISLSDSCRSLDDNETKWDVYFNHKWTPTPLAIEANNNVTFLSFSNICWFDDFYGVLFKECKRLHTLDVTIECNSNDYNCAPLRLLDSLHLTKSLRNLRILAESVENFHRVFGALTACQTLENVHISETGSDFEYKSDQYDVREYLEAPCVPSLIEKCCNLYSLFIQANIDKNALVTLEAAMTFAARKFRRDYLHIQICSSKGGWNPFADVFSPSPLHIKN